jgi:hypothetical protein
VLLTKLAAPRLNGQMTQWRNVSIPRANSKRIPGIGFSELDPQGG